MLKKLKYLFLIIITFFLIVEIGLRIFACEKLRRVERVEYVIDKDLGYRYKPNSEGYYINQAFKNHYKINSKGFNWDKFVKEKKDGVFRIILLGYSDDNGMITNGTNSYARLLQKKFKNNKDNIEILNFSIDGRGRSLRHLKFAKDSLMAFNPDIILFNLAFPIIDRNEYRKTYRGIMITSSNYEHDFDNVKKFIDEKVLVPSKTSFMYNVSYIFRYLCKIYIDNKNNTLLKKTEKLFFKNWKEKYYFRAYLQAYVRGRVVNLDHKWNLNIKKYSNKESLILYNKFTDSINKSNSRLVLFTVYKGINPKLINVLKKNNLEIVNLNIEKKKDYTFGKIDGHSTQKAHKVIAEKFYERFYKDTVIPRHFFSQKTHSYFELH